MTNEGQPGGNEQVPGTVISIPFRAEGYLLASLSDDAEARPTDGIHRSRRPGGAEKPEARRGLDGPVLRHTARNPPSKLLPRLHAWFLPLENCTTNALDRHTVQRPCHRRLSPMEAR